MTFIRTSAGASARGMSSISIVTVIVTITILSVCPIDLMVANIEDATPYSALSTHDITALVLGDEKSENPRPVITRAMIITKICVSRPMKININVPAAQNAIPTEDIMKGEILSENIPMTGESTAMIMG